MSKIFKIAKAFNPLTKCIVLVIVLLLSSLLVLKTTTNVLADEDTQPPTTPTFLHISMTSPNSVTLSWNASTDNVGVAGYRIYRNLGSTANVTQLNHTYYNLPAGTHSFIVRAFDAAQNLSTASNFVIYFSIGTTGPTPTPTPTSSPTPTNTPTPTFTPTPTNTPTPTATPTPAPVLTVESFNPYKDVFVRSGSSNDNEGASNDLVVQRTGKNRSIIDFSTAPFANLNVENSSDIVSAVLKVNITSNSNNWGSTGRPLTAHAVTKNWAEGNGNGGSRGTGSGATWNCAVDSNISNSQTNCSGSTAWDMNTPSGIWQSTPSDSVTIVNNQSGVVEFDVTNDVKAMVDGTTYYGWIIKLENEGQNGGITFGSRESIAPPEITITYWE